MSDIDDQLTIDGVKGIKLHYQQSLPPDPRAWVLIVHGWGEHCGRYRHVIDALFQSGYAVATYDQRGHGRSEGLKTYVQLFQDYVDDLAIVVRIVMQKVNQTPVFLLAHSMGGLVAVQYCIQFKPLLRGVVLSGASLKVNADFSPFLQKMSGIVSFIAPRLPAVKLDNHLLSRDPKVLEIAMKDPHHYKGGIRARTGAEILKTTRGVQSRMQEFTLPVLILHGGDDKISEPGGSDTFYQRIDSADKQLKKYPGAFHEILNELNKAEVISDILQWLKVRA